MEIADMFRTEKQRQIIQALERIHMGTTRDIIDAIGCKRPTYAYGRHIKNPDRRGCGPRVRLQRRQARILAIAQEGKE